MTPSRSTQSIVDLPELDDPRVVVVGYAGRDLESVQHHIDELAAIGVAPPPEVPMFYRMPATSLTRSSKIEVQGAGTSGEAEPVLVRSGSRWFLTVGSDHTDRDLETKDIALSKQVCAKPIASRGILLHGDPSRGDADELWDSVRMHSWVDGVLYQTGRLSSLRYPSDLISRVAGAVEHTGDLVIFGGTLPLLDGTFRPGRVFKASLEMPGAAPVELRYDTTKKEKDRDEQA